MAKDRTTEQSHYFTILGSAEEIEKIVPTLNSEFGGCLLLPKAQHTVFSKLMKEGVALHVMDAGKKKEGKECSRAGACKEATDIEMPKKPDFTNLDLKNHLDWRLDTIGHEFVSLKKENTGLKKDLAQYLTNIAKRVEPEYFQWIFTIMGAGSVNGAATLLGIPNSSFAAKLRQYASRGGVYATLFAMIKVRKTSGIKSVESFSEEFAAHQPERFSDPCHISDLLNGLENLNADNWPGVRDELVELVREEFL